MPVNRWNHRLHLGDIFHNDDLTFEAKRDEIVRRIKAARWYREGGYTIESIVEELAAAEDAAAFDDAWGLFYDWCDGERVWVETIRATPRVNA
jgi:hypothetical protein